MKKKIISCHLAKAVNYGDSVAWSPQEEAQRWKIVELEVEELRKYISALISVEWVRSVEVVSQKVYNSEDQMVSVVLSIEWCEEDSPVGSDAIDSFISEITSIIAQAQDALQQLSAQDSPERCPLVSCSEKHKGDQVLVTNKIAKPVAEILRKISAKSSRTGTADVVLEGAEDSFLVPRVGESPITLTEEECESVAGVKGVIEDQCRVRLRMEEDSRIVILSCQPSMFEDLLSAQLGKKRLAVTWKKTVRWERGWPKYHAGVLTSYAEKELNRRLPGL